MSLGLQGRLRSARRIAIVRASRIGDFLCATPAFRAIRYAAVGSPCLDLIGRTTLPQLGAILEKVSVLLTNDSGPAHIAYALGTPTVTVFGGTDPLVWAPPEGSHEILAHDVPCRPCSAPTCPIGYRCLKEITVNQVVVAARDVAGRTLPPDPGPPQSGSSGAGT